MTVTFNPDADDKSKRETYDPMAQFESFRFESAVPDAMRSFATMAVTNTRDNYERAKAAVDAGLEAVERSYDAAGQAAAALNRKIIDIAQQNVNSGFDLARSLASAKNLAEIVELQGAYWRKHFENLMSQAEEARRLSGNGSAETAEPIKQQAVQQTEAAQGQSKQTIDETAEATGAQAKDVERDLRQAG